MNETHKQVAAIQANAHKFKSPARSVETSNHPKAIATIDEIFIRLKAICSVGNAFKTEKEEVIVKQEWMLALREEGVTRQSMIDDGINGIRAKARRNRSTTWFPTIGEFIDLCKGSDNTLDLAQRALELFNSNQQQIDSIGQKVAGKHGFDLKTMKAADTEKNFIRLYLKYAENNPIEPLEHALLTEVVRLSPEQQKDADRRAQAAMNEFFAKYSAEYRTKPKAKDKKPVGIKKGSTRADAYKTIRALDMERERQLALIKNKLGDK